MFPFLVPTESGASCSKDSDCKHMFGGWPGMCVDFKCRRQDGNSGPTVVTPSTREPWSMSLEECISLDTKDKCREHWKENFRGYVIHRKDNMCECGSPGTFHYNQRKDKCQKDHDDNFDGYLHNCPGYYLQETCDCGLKNQSVPRLFTPLQ